MSNSRKTGTAGESAVVAYLRDHGWPHAERRALHGAADRGDVTGTPSICWELKSGHKAEQAGDSRIAGWLAETEQERHAAGADIGVLVTKRPGYGPSRAAAWWAHMDVATLAILLNSDPVEGDSEPVRMHLSTAVRLLRLAGYGDPPGEEVGPVEEWD